MNRAPPPRVMFDRLLKILKVEESKFVPADRVHVVGGGWRKQPPRMTKGISLDLQRLGGRDGTRIQIEVYSGEGTGCSMSSLLYSCGAREFAEKVWAIEAAEEIKDRLK